MVNIVIGASMVLFLRCFLFFPQKLEAKSLIKLNFAKNNDGKYVFNDKKVKATLVLLEHSVRAVGEQDDDGEGGRRGRDNNSAAGTLHEIPLDLCVR